jgi:2-polyprenyl-3-methyl-5-hydroxy-6-metoxy-1,4-benzoquinol methylase
MANADTQPAEQHPRVSPGGKYVECLVCGGAPLVPLLGYESAHLVRCPSCNLTFAGRRAADAELAEHYRGYGVRWFDSDITRQRYNELLDGFEQHRQTNRILDMGCGAGYFVEEAVRRGWDAYGSEFGELPRQLSRDKNLNIVNAPVRLGDFPKGHFDVVTAFEVVEHLRDPIDELSVVRALVREGGLLYCTTPNFNSAARRVMRVRWPIIAYPEHLIYFTTPTLTRWLAGGGFEPLRVTTTGISPTALASTLPTSLAPRSRSAPPEQTLDQRLRGILERSGALRGVKHGLNQALTLAGLGDTIKGWFVRRHE